MSLENKKIVIIGGTSGMGLATAKAAIATGASVTIASRSKEKLETTQKEIGGHVEAQPIDLMQENSIRDLFQTVGSIDHLVVSGSSTKSSSFRELATEDAKASMASKFWAANVISGSCSDGRKPRVVSWLTSNGGNNCTGLNTEQNCLELQFLFLWG